MFEKADDVMKVAVKASMAGAAQGVAVTIKDLAQVLAYDEIR